jgi:hypothetical protein
MTPDEWAIDVLKEYHPHVSGLGYKPVLLGRLISAAIRDAVSEEREACAKVVEEYQECDNDYNPSLAPFVAKYGTDVLAVAIRGRP